MTIRLALFALANLLAWIAWWQWSARDRGLLRIEEFSPGDGARCARTQPWRLRFNLAMVGGADAPVTGMPVLVHPGVDGAWRWSDERTLDFTPARPLPPATRFALAVPAGLRSRDGFTLARGFAASVHTAPLAVVGIRVIGDEPWSQLLECSFSERVLPADLLARLSVSDQDDRAVHAVAVDAAPATQVRVRLGLGERAAPRRLAVTVRAGLTSSDGPLGLETDHRTTVDCSHDLRLEARIEHGRPGEKPWLALRGNRPLRVEDLRRVLSLEPALPFTVGGGAWDQAWNNAWTARIDADFLPGQRYVLVVAAPPSGVVGRFPVPDRLPVTIPDAPPGLRLAYERGQLGSRGARALAAQTVNLRSAEVAVRRLYDSNLVEWLCRGQDRHGHAALAGDLGRELVRQPLALPDAANQAHTLRLDLDRLLAGGAGDGVYLVSLSAGAEDARPGAYAHDRWRWRNHDAAVVSLSDLALSARLGADGALLWCTSLADATPQASVRVRLFSRQRQPLGSALTGADGLTRIALPPGETPLVAIADRTPGDSAPAELTWLELSGRRLSDDRLADRGRPWLRHGHEAFVWSERGVHRPGETVRLRAIVRGVGGAPPPADLPLRWRVQRPDHRDWRELPARLDADGLALCDLALPDDLPTGAYAVSLGLPGAAPCGGTSVLVEEFLPDRLAARIEVDGDGRRWPLGGAALTVRVRGDWLFGQPAAGCAASLGARLEPAAFATLAWGGWSFGDHAGLARELGVARATGSELPTTRHDLDAAGRAAVPIAALPGAAGTWHPWRLLLSATVTEPGGRGTTVRRDLAIDPQPHYLALRRAAGGDPAVAAVDLALVRPDGAPAAWTGSLEACVQRVEWNSILVDERGEVRYHSHRRLDPAGEPQTVAVTDGRARLACPLPRAGSHVLCVRDAAGSLFATLPLERSDGTGWDESIDRGRPEALTVTVEGDANPAAAPADADAADVGPADPPTRQPADLLLPLRPGTTAQVVVKSPFPGRLLITVETDRVRWTACQAMTASAARVPLPVEDWGPSAVVTATVVRDVRSDVPWRVHRAYGATAVRIDRSAAALVAGIAAPAEVRPGRDLDAVVTVADALGRPLPGATVVVAAVDEGVLRLTRHPQPDPHGFFHGPRRHEVQAWDAYARLMPEVPDAQVPTGGDGGGGTYRSSVRVERAHVLAWTSGRLTSDAAGQVRVAVPLPAAFAGSVRLTAVAVSGTRCGAATRPVAVRAALVVQAAWPRFLAPGDRGQVAVTVFNRTAAAGRARLRLEPGGAPLAAGDGVAEVDLAAGASATLPLALAAGDAVGAAHATLHVALGDERFSERMPLPVRPAHPALVSAGELIAAPDAPATLPAAAAVLAGTGRLRVRVGPLPALALPSALDALFRYPHGCAEQTVSSAFPLVAIADLGAQVAPGHFAPAAIALRLETGWSRLATMQCADGGIGSWPGAHDSWDWATVYATHFLHECAAAGHPPPRALLDRLDAWCRTRLERDDASDLTAYAAYALARGGQAPLPALARLEAALAAGGSPAMRCYVAGAWASAGARERGRRLLPDDPPTARTWRDLGGWCGSPMRDRALVLLAYADLRPEHPALPRLAGDLARDGLGGAHAPAQWRSTQDLAWATLALGRWLRVAKAATPCERVELVVDGATVALAGPGETLRWEAPAGTTPGAVSVRCRGPADARAHVDWLRDGVPLTPPPPSDHGVSVRRRYLTLDGQPIAGALRLGQAVRVELVLDADDALANAVVEDLLPAGLEAENPRLAASAQDTRAPASDRWQPQRLDVRDDRVVAFGDLPRGVRRFHYLARAVGVGDFIAPPARVEAQYDSALRSLSPAGRMRVEP